MSSPHPNSSSYTHHNDDYHHTHRTNFKKKVIRVDDEEGSKLIRRRCLPPHRIFCVSTTSYLVVLLFGLLGPDRMQFTQSFTHPTNQLHTQYHHHQHHHPHAFICPLFQPYPPPPPTPLLMSRPSDINTTEDPRLYRLRIPRAPGIEWGTDLSFSFVYVRTMDPD